METEDEREDGGRGGRRKLDLRQHIGRVRARLVSQADRALERFSDSGMYQDREQTVFVLNKKEYTAPWRHKPQLVCL